MKASDVDDGSSSEGEEEEDYSDSAKKSASKGVGVLCCRCHSGFHSLELPIVGIMRGPFHEM